MELPSRIDSFDRALESNSTYREMISRMARIGPSQLAKLSESGNSILKEGVL